jgi:MFS family permease
LFLSGLSLFGAMLLLPLYFQQVQAHTALIAGLLLVPQGVGSLLTKGVVGRLTDSIGARPIVIGGVLLAAVGTVAFAVAGPHANNVLLGASLVVRGAGLGAVPVAVMRAAYQGLRREQIPHASSATRILLQIGGSFVVAVLAVILQQQITGRTDPAQLSGGFNGAF